MGSAEKAKKRLAQDKALMESLENLAGVESKREAGLLLTDTKEATDERLRVSKAMRKYGGSFVAALGAALLAVRELEGVVNSLKVELNSMKEEKCKWQREANRLNAKLEDAKLAE